MAEFAPVANLPMYHELLNARQLGEYHLLIATEVNKDPRNWRDFWALARSELGAGTHPFIIMDNGLIETGKPTSAAELIAAADAVNASCIVLPDVLGDVDGTLELAWAANHALQASSFPLLGVLQGTTPPEVMKCLDEYRAMRVKYLSVPRVMVEFFGSRAPLVDWVASVWPRDEPFMHLLGFSDNLSDDVRSARHPMVMGIDSAVPIWAARKGFDLADGGAGLVMGKRHKDYWEHVPADGELEMAISNVKEVRRWLTAAKVAPTPQAL